MHRRFSILLLKPWRRGFPHLATFATLALESGGDPSVFASPPPSTTTTTAAPTWPLSGEPPRSPKPRRRQLAGIATVVVTALIVASFVVALNLRGGSPPSTATTTALTATATAAARATVAATSAPSLNPAATASSTSSANPASFVCANPAGSSLVYAYQNQNGALFTVMGCSTPTLVYAGQGTAWPVAWSPTNRYLAADFVPQDGQPSALDRVLILDPQHGAAIPTHYGTGFGPNVSGGQTYRIFLGWIDDATFVGAVVPIVSGQNEPVTGPASIVRVDVASQQETKVATVTWFADAKVRGGGKYLFYGGYQSASEGQGFVHRLDLTTGQDTKVAPLGYAGQGGCQGSPICNWTAPWDARADGTGVIFHNPGPTRSWSDIYQPPDSPLYLDNIDFPSPVDPIVAKLATSLTTPVLSPDGAYVATTGSSYDPADPFNHPQTGLTRMGSSTTTLMDGRSVAWRSDSRAVVLMYDNGPVLYDLVSGTTTALQASTSSYLWGN